MTLPLTLEELSARVEAELADFLAGRDMPLYRMMAYHLGWEDQRGRSRGPATGFRAHGAACILACDVAGGDPETSLPAAAAVELVHGFAEIHDDVQGGNPSRDNRDSVWWIWGPAQAINAGDGMHAIARLALFRLLERGVSQVATFEAIHLLNEASLELCEGRFQDLDAQERIDLSVDRYLEMATRKSGALLSGAMKLGAVVAGASEAVGKGLGECGARLGVAAQIRGDLRDLWGDDQKDAPPSPEVLNKKKLLPVVYALEKATISEKRRMGQVYFKRVLEPDDVVDIRRVVEELGAKKYCEEQVDRYRALALAALDVPGISAGGLKAIDRFAEAFLRV